MSEEQEQMRVEFIRNNREKDWNALAIEMAMSTSYTKRQWEEAIEVVRKDPNPLTVEQAAKVFESARVFNIEPKGLATAVWTLLNG